MKLTEQHIREFFPRDMRFLHFVAKRYNYTFFNDEAVRKANHLASINITKLFHKGKEFEDNEHLYGYVMSVFRYAILNSYNQKVNDKYLQVSLESDLTYGDEGDEYNKFYNKAVSYDDEYDNTADKVYEMLSKRLSPVPRQILHLKYKESLKDAEVVSKLGIDYTLYRRMKRLIEREYKNINNKIEKANNENKQEQRKYPTFSSPKAVQRLSGKVWSEPFESNKADANSVSKAMSWIHPDQ